MGCEGIEYHEWAVSLVRASLIPQSLDNVGSYSLEADNGYDPPAFIRRL